MNSLVFKSRYLVINHMPPHLWSFGVGISSDDWSNQRQVRLYINFYRWGLYLGILVNIKLLMLTNKILNK